MFPFPLDDGSWAAFVGTSHQETPNPWPGGRWPVSLATAPALAGPWTRRNAAAPAAPADAPCVDLNGGFSENPVVARRPDDAAACLAALRHAGAHVLPSESVFYALLRDVRHPFFKTYTQLVKSHG
jgi:hypothetical protein